MPCLNRRCFSIAYHRYPTDTLCTMMITNLHSTFLSAAIYVSWEALEVRKREGRFILGRTIIISGRLFFFLGSVYYIDIVPTKYMDCTRVLTMLKLVKVRIGAV